MISEAKYRGDGVYLSISADTSIYPELRRLHNISATTGGLKVKIADARRYKPGRKHLQVWNSGSNSFALCTDDAATLTTLTAGQWATVSLLDNSTQAGVWELHVGTAGSAPQAPPTTLMFFAGGAANDKRMDEYNQALDAWTVKSNATFSRTEGSCSTVGGAGWYMGSDTADNRLVEHYDPDVWTTGTSMPGNAADGSERDCASTMSGKAYVFGGTNVTLRTVEYDGATWVTKSSRPAGRGYTQATQGGFPGWDISNGTTYLLSGGNATDEGHNFVDSYLGSTDTYTARTERPLPIYFAEGRGKNDSAGAIFVFGGSTGAGDTYTDRVTKYVTTTDTHSTAAPFPVPTEELMGSAYGSKCYVGFGQDDVVPGTDAGYVKSMREFDMVLETYTVKSSAGQAKQDQCQNQSTAIQP